MKYSQKLNAITSIVFGVIIAITSAITIPMQSAYAATAEAQITILYDAFSRDPSLKKDWGFSALIEVGGKRILFDTGNNADIFAHNVKTKGIDLTNLDLVIMSHRHGDHIGGLNYLLSINPDVPIYAPKENFGVFGAALPGSFYKRNESLPAEMRYFNGEPAETLHFGSPWPQANFNLISQSTEILPGFHLILLKGSWGVDLDVMELSLAIDTPEGTVLIVGCSHPTIEKIVATTKMEIDKPIHLILGGLHLLPATDDQTQRIATALHDKWGIHWLAPDHCTGEPAFEILKKTFGDRYLYAGLGETLSLGSDPSAGITQNTSQLFDNEEDLENYRHLSLLHSDAHGFTVAHTPNSTEATAGN